MKARKITGIAVAMITLACFIALLWKGPWWIDGKHLGHDLTPGEGAVVTGFRTTLVAIGAGVIAAFGLYYTDRNLKNSKEALKHTQESTQEQLQLTRLSIEHSEKSAVRQAELTREDQVTNRYVEAVKLTGSDSDTEKLGGIYALERIMHDSEKDHAMVVEFLCAFIREQAHTKRTQVSARPKEPVQAALTVLGRRPVRPERGRLNFRESSLQGASMTSGRFAGAVFDDCFLDNAQASDADFKEASFIRASLKRAWIQRANLRTTDLDKCDMSDGNFARTDFSDASLVKCNLSNVMFFGADFTEATLDSSWAHGAHFGSAKLAKCYPEGACLDGANLSDAEGITDTFLAGAYVTAETRLPKNMRNTEAANQAISRTENAFSKKGHDHQA
ncbi:pentapeptide repeat-containing protein [Streptomyces griseus]|uniref:pentapeptide repeat-containing protein n=1 Tax=Streptomyces griseus TaxID=1911 RepID=UPI00403CD1C1